MSKETKLVRIDAKVLDAVEKHLQKTKQSIGGFFELAAIQKIRTDKELIKMSKQHDKK